MRASPIELATLSALDTNHDGLVDANDANFNQLTVWQDANHDGVADANELSSLADHGIDGISLNGVSIEGYLDAQTLLAQPASGEALVAVQGSDAQLAKLASLDFGDLLIGGDHYLDLDQALKDSPLTGSQSEGASASGPAASEAQPGASSSEAAQQHADAPPPSVDLGAAQGSSGTPAQQTPSQSQAAKPMTVRPRPPAPITPKRLPSPSMSMTAPSRPRTTRSPKRAVCGSRGPRGRGGG